MKTLLAIVVKNMLVKYNVNRLETILRDKFPEINAELYYSRRKKLVHLAVDRCIYEYKNHRKLLDEIRSFFYKHFRREFTLDRPIRLVPTIKWKFDLLNTEELIEHDTLEKHFIELKGYFKDLISGALVIVCNDILTLVLKDEVQLMKLNCHYSHGFCTTSIFKTSEFL